jgi:hypothetical protein
MEVTMKAFLHTLKQRMLASPIVSGIVGAIFSIGAIIVGFGFIWASFLVPAMLDGYDTVHSPTDVVDVVYHAYVRGYFTYHSFLGVIIGALMVFGGAHLLRRPVEFGRFVIRDGRPESGNE